MLLPSLTAATTAIKAHTALACASAAEGVADGCSTSNGMRSVCAACACDHAAAVVATLESLTGLLGAASGAAGVDGGTSLVASGELQWLSSCLSNAGERLEIRCRGSVKACVGVHACGCGWVCVSGKFQQCSARCYVQQYPPQACTLTRTHTSYMCALKI